jgi:hypothetical protein
MTIFGFSFGKVAKTSASSEFSRFFREASSGEKKKVYLDVARKASADQRKVIEGSRA